jgi:hypothetical protein
MQGLPNMHNSCVSVHVSESLHQLTEGADAPVLLNCQHANAAQSLLHFVLPAGIAQCSAQAAGTL